MAWTELTRRRAALRAGLMLCQKIRFLRVKKKKVRPWNWWPRVRLNIRLCCNISQSGVSTMILRANTSLRLSTAE